MKLLLVGATGLVGSHVLALALADERVSSVVAPVRHPLPQHPKLFAPLLPKRWHVNPAENIARALLNAAIESPAGVRVITSESLVKEKSSSN